MTAFSSYLGFVQANARFLLVGALFTFLSSFGQTFFIAVFGGDIRAEYGLSNGQWSLIYMIGTMVSAGCMVFAGGLSDIFRVRILGISVIFLLALSCLVMAMNSAVMLLPVVILCLRFFGQGMAHHIGIVAISRWFVSTRGTALATASLGFMLAEAIMPLTIVWLKRFFEWREIWVGCAILAVLTTPILYALLRTERTPQSISSADSTLGMDGRHWTRKHALRHPLFWALIPSVTLFPAFGTAFWFHQVHFAELKGWEHLELVAVFPLGTLSFVTFTFVYGWAIDRFGSGKLFPLYLLPAAIGFVLHAFAPSIGWSALAVIFMGMAGGGAATLPAAVWSSYFGTRYLGSLKSAVAACMVLGSAIGPGLSGWLIDIGVGFDTQLLAYALSFVFAGLVCFLPLRDATEKLPKLA